MKPMPFSFRSVAAFLGILFLAWLVIEFNSRMQELNLLTEQRDAARIEATQAAATETYLETQVAYANSTQAVIDWAHTQGKQALPGEHVVIPVGVPGSEPVVVASPTPVPTVAPNWRQWWDLFFGK